MVLVLLQLGLLLMLQLQLEVVLVPPVQVERRSALHRNLWVVDPMDRFVAMDQQLFADPMDHFCNGSKAGVALASGAAGP